MADIEQNRRILFRIRNDRTPLALRRYSRLRDRFPCRIATLIPVDESCCMMPASSLDEGASTGDGQLMERGCGARGGHENGTGDVCCRSRPHPTERTTVRTSRGALRSPPTATTSGRHDGWLKGGASVRWTKAGSPARTGTGKVRRAPAVPRYRKRGAWGWKDAAAGAPTSATLRLRTGVRRAPAIPFAREGPKSGGTRINPADRGAGMRMCVHASTDASPSFLRKNTSRNQGNSFATKRLGRIDRRSSRRTRGSSFHPSAVSG